MTARTCTLLKLDAVSKHWTFFARTGKARLTEAPLSLYQEPLPRRGTHSGTEYLRTCRRATGFLGWGFLEAFPVCAICIACQPAGTAVNLSISTVNPAVKGSDQRDLPVSPAGGTARQPASPLDLRVFPWGGAPSLPALPFWRSAFSYLLWYYQDTLKSLQLSRCQLVSATPSSGTQRVQPFLTPFHRLPPISIHHRSLLRSNSDHRPTLWPLYYNPRHSKTGDLITSQQQPVLLQAQQHYVHDRDHDHDDHNSRPGPDHRTHSAVHLVRVVALQLHTSPFAGFKDTRVLLRCHIHAVSLASAVHQLDSATSPTTRPPLSQPALGQIHHPQN